MAVFPLAAVLALFQGANPAPAVERPLEPGRPVEGQLAPGEGHSYSTASSISPLTAS